MHPGGGDLHRTGSLITVGTDWLEVCTEYRVGTGGDGTGEGPSGAELAQGLPNRVTHMQSLVPGGAKPEPASCFGPTPADLGLRLEASPAGSCKGGFRCGPRLVFVTGRYLSLADRAGEQRGTPDSLHTDQVPQEGRLIKTWARRCATVTSRTSPEVGSFVEIIRAGQTARQMMRVGR